jgi:hypothetical protein
MEPNETGCEGVDCIHVAQETDPLGVVLNNVVELCKSLEVS